MTDIHGRYVVMCPIIGLWYWCTISISCSAYWARDEKQARRWYYLRRLFKINAVFLFIIPGMICFALAKSGINTDIQHRLIDANGNVIREQAQGAFALLVTHVLRLE
jgi:SSS family solute:Na+ symporter